MSNPSRNTSNSCLTEIQRYLGIDSAIHQKITQTGRVDTLQDSEEGEIQAIKLSLSIRGTAGKGRKKREEEEEELLCTGSKEVQVTQGFPRGTELNIKGKGKSRQQIQEDPRQTKITHAFNSSTMSIPSQVPQKSSLDPFRLIKPPKDGDRNLPPQFGSSKRSKAVSSPHSLPSHIHDKQSATKMSIKLSHLSGTSSRGSIPFRINSGVEAYGSSLTLSNVHSFGQEHRRSIPNTFNEFVPSKYFDQSPKNQYIKNAKKHTYEHSGLNGTRDDRSGGSGNKLDEEAATVVIIDGEGEDPIENVPLHGKWKGKGKQREDEQVTVDDFDENPNGPRVQHVSVYGRAQGKVEGLIQRFENDGGIENREKTNRVANMRPRGRPSKEHKNGEEEEDPMILVSNPIMPNMGKTLYFFYIEKITIDGKIMPGIKGKPLKFMVKGSHPKSCNVSITNGESKTADIPLQSVALCGIVREKPTVYLKIDYAAIAAVISRLWPNLHGQLKSGMKEQTTIKIVGNSTKDYDSSKYTQMGHILDNSLHKGRIEFFNQHAEEALCTFAIVGVWLDSDKPRTQPQQTRIVNSIKGRKGNEGRSTGKPQDCFKPTAPAETSAPKRINPPTRPPPPSKIKPKLSPYKLDDGDDDETATVSKEEAPPSRVTRSKVTAEQSKAEMENLDEVMAVFPPEGTGSVSITRRDFNRLVPDEFLNDTLIEYGLRKIQYDLKNEGFDIADQVHIFNSFFYKKLTHRKRTARSKKGDGSTELKKTSRIDYESVRKWTSKVDIFSKKFIIVPINEHLHWYVAIIGNPGLVLKPPEQKKSQSPPHAQFRRSSRLSQAENLETSDTEPDENADQSMDIDSLDQTLRDTSIHESLEERDVPMELDSAPDGPKKSTEEVIEQANDEEKETAVGYDWVSKPFILILDSMNSTHRAAALNLRAYLDEEAKDKKKVENNSAEQTDAPYKPSCPRQDNYSDCGLFVLHYIELFLRNPEAISTLVHKKYKDPGEESWHEEAWQMNLLKDNAKRIGLQKDLLQLETDYKVAQRRKNEEKKRKKLDEEATASTEDHKPESEVDQRPSKRRRTSNKGVPTASIEEIVSPSIESTLALSKKEDEEGPKTNGKDVSSIEVEIGKIDDDVVMVDAGDALEEGVGQAIRRETEVQEKGGQSTDGSDNLPFPAVRSSTLTEKPRPSRSTEQNELLAKVEIESKSTDGRTASRTPTTEGVLERKEGSPNVGTSEPTSTVEVDDNDQSHNVKQRSLSEEKNKEPSGIASATKSSKFQPVTHVINGKKKNHSSPSKGRGRKSDIKDTILIVDE